MSATKQILILFLNVLAVFCVGLVLSRLAVPSAPVRDAQALDSVGPPETGDVAKDAREYLRSVHVSPMSEPLSALLANPLLEPEPTQAHPLLGKDAPDFTLTDDRGESHQLSRMLEQGPVVIVFYYGYFCSHCVAQLFGIDGDLARFRELKAQVVALSADSTEVTAARFAEYGRFGFPVLFDEKNQVAGLYGAYRPAEGNRDEELRHGTFVIGRDGKVQWANLVTQPFTDNRSLLLILAGAAEP